MDPILIGKFINEERKRKKLTQAELAKKLSVTSQAISKWENGRGIPDIESIKKLSEIFEIDIEEILNGSKKVKKNKKRIYIIIAIIILLIGILLFAFLKPKDSFNFSNIATDNNAFTIKGVIAYSKNKKSIYISEVTYALEDENRFKNIECVLYESLGEVEKKITQWGKLNEKEKNTYYLSELLNGIEFNIDNYDCSCNSLDCNNLYLKINALNEENKIITYNIPIQISSSCN